MKHPLLRAIRAMLIPIALAPLIHAEDSDIRSPTPLSIYSIGDSTMADKPIDNGNPERGWCQALKGFAKPGIRFENHAVNGRSSKSFIGEGRWDVVKDKLNPDDWLLIQFGHNDQKFKSPDRFSNPYSTYRYNLETYVREAKERGAHPILMSSIVRRKFNEYGTLEDTHGVYPWVARQVAREQGIPFVDMQLLTEITLSELGIEESKKLHLVFEAGEHPFFPDGKSDNTHLSERGAEIYATLFLEAIKRQQLPLAAYFE